MGVPAGGPGWVGVDPPGVVKRSLISNLRQESSKKKPFNYYQKMLNYVNKKLINLGMGILQVFCCPPPHRKLPNSALGVLQGSPQKQTTNIIHCRSTNITRPRISPRGYYLENWLKSRQSTAIIGVNLHPGSSSDQCPISAQYLLNIPKCAQHLLCFTCHQF